MLITYKELLERKGGATGISYRSLLQTEEWQKKRERILRRDNHSCTKCTYQETEADYKRATQEEIDEYQVEFERVKGKIQEMLESISQNYEHFKVIRDLTGVDLIDDCSHFATPLYVRNYGFRQLHIHHTYYVNGKLPWEYDDESLITLCNVCHQAVHDKDEIQVFADDEKPFGIFSVLCSKCGGSGYLPQYHYYMNGVCFRCDGFGFTV